MSSVNKHQQAECASASAGEEYKSLPSQSILVIEDNQDVRMMVRDILELAGFQVLEAADGLSGIRLAKRTSPALIFCDITMPHLDGFETLATLRQEPSIAAIPFIFLTAVSQREYQDRGMEAAADDFLIKPFTSEELIAAAKTKLQKKRPSLKRPWKNHGT